MQNLRALGLAAALSAVSCSSMAAVSSHDFYVKALGGVALSNVNSLNSVEAGETSITSNVITSNQAKAFGAAVGYQLPNSPFSVELQALRINSQDFKMANFYPADGYNENAYMHARSNVLLLNGLYALPSYKCFTPFIGGGIGLTQNKVNADYRSTTEASHGVWQDHTSTHFAYDLTAGINYQLTNHMGVSLAYQYLSLGKLSSGDTYTSNSAESGRQILSADRLSSNNILLGLSYTF